MTNDKPVDIQRKQLTLSLNSRKAGVIVAKNHLQSLQKGVQVEIKGRRSPPKSSIENKLDSSKDLLVKINAVRNASNTSSSGTLEHGSLLDKLKREEPEAPKIELIASEVLAQHKTAAQKLQENEAEQRAIRARKKAKELAVVPQVHKEDNSANKRRTLKTFISNEAADTGRVKSLAATRRRFEKNRQQSSDSGQRQKLFREITIPDFITVSDLANRMSERGSDVVKKLFSMGMIVTINQTIDGDTAELIATDFGHKSRRVAESEIENSLETLDYSVNLSPRPPVVTVMGHVDHGKTSMLDAMRNTNVIASESGGITQHIGASRVKISTKNHPDRYITFLDTPGHEAFTEMRARGANATDIVVLVVAADDGIKEQTIEAIAHAKAAKVPIIVAINKIDKPAADAARVTNELLNHGIVSEEFGGEAIFVSVSAKEGTGIDKLQDAILLQAEMLELKSNNSLAAKGVVVEAKIDPARGVTATLLVQDGVLRDGDIVVAGSGYGKIRRMTDEHRHRLTEVFASMPIEILGLDSAPNAGDSFAVATSEKQAREIVSYRIRRSKDERVVAESKRTLEQLFAKTEAGGGLKELMVVIKSDVHGSAEAISSSLAKLGTSDVAIKILHSATGGITQSDVSLAFASNAIVVGFNVRANNQARDLARSRSVDIRYYSIIYDLVEDIKLALTGLLKPLIKEEYIGAAEIRQIFTVTGQGKIAGSMVTDGMISRGAKVRLLRNNIIIHDGSLKTLRRFKDDVKEVRSGYECGIAFENYEDIKEGDMLEVYNLIEEKQKL